MVIGTGGKEDLVRIENEERRRTCSIPTWPEPESPPSPLPFFYSFSLTRLRRNHVLSYSFRTHIHVHTDVSLFLLIRILLALSPFYDSSLFRRFFAGRLCRSKRAWLFRQRMFNRSIVSVGRAADFPLGRSTPLLKFGGGGILLLLGSSRVPFVFFLRLLHLHIFTLIRLFAGGWYLITATDLPISATFLETHNAPLLGGWAVASPDHRRQEGKGWTRTRRHQEQGRIFFASFATSSFNSLSVHVVSFLCFHCRHWLYEESRYRRASTRPRTPLYRAQSRLLTPSFPDASDITPFIALHPNPRIDLSVNLTRTHSIY